MTTLSPLRRTLAVSLLCGLGQLAAGDAPAAGGAMAAAPFSDPAFFPIGVWAQEPKHAAAYQAMGVNLYLSIPGTVGAEQLAQLKAAGMSAIIKQTAATLALAADRTIIGWMHGDEPDNMKANPDKTAKKKFVKGTSPAEIITDYAALQAKDPTRPVLLNLGQGVANDAWQGGWAKEPDYREFLKGCDIVSYDIYPMAGEREEVTGKLELIPKGVERLRTWSGDAKTVWFITEASHIKNKERMATPAEIRSEVWMALIAGARGIVYFCHQWEPTRDFSFPVNDAATRAALTAVNRQVRELAPVLNAPTVVGGATVASSDPAVPMSVMVKRHQGATYVFVAALRRDEVTGTITVKGLPAKATAEVIGEGRTLEVAGGVFQDRFASYGVHLYRIATP